MAKAMSAYAPGGPAEKMAEGTWHTRCDGCGAGYDVEEWSKLGLVTRVEAGSLAAHVTTRRNGLRAIASNSPSQLAGTIVVPPTRIE